MGYVKLALISLACLIGEGAIVVGIAWGLGAALYEPHTNPVPTCIPTVDHCPMN